MNAVMSASVNGWEFLALSASLLHVVSNILDVLN